MFLCCKSLRLLTVVVVASFQLLSSFELISNKFTEENQFGSTIARCEYSALKLGTDLADVFNAPVGDMDWDERVHQDFIAENLAFAPWIAHGLHNTAGQTLTGKSAKDLQEKRGFSGQKIDNSPYAVLNHKWLYMFGDSTTRQVWASFAASFKGNNFERNAKEWTRHYCGKQGPRAHHVKGGHFDDEGWRGPCGVNEVTCHISGFGDLGTLSFDWKHFPYEDYDDHFWGDSGPWMAGFGGEGIRRPDVLTLQTGMHTCWHASPQGLYSAHLTEVNTTMIEKHMKDFQKLMKAVRRVVNHVGEVYKNDSIVNNTPLKPPPIVVVLTAGATGMGQEGSSIDDCIVRFNRVATDAAHNHGFPVLDRGELERRLMYRSTASESPNLQPDMHLAQPAQNIIATSLLHIISCLNATAFSAGEPVKRKPGRKIAPQGPLHNPPG